MDISKKPTLAEKQAFWTEQLPKFESKYWLPSHFEFLIFDMDQGNYVIKDGLDPSFDDDATEIWHRVNTGWAMWKKAINFTKAPAVPEVKDIGNELQSWVAVWSFKARHDREDYIVVDANLLAEKIEKLTGANA
ncbi:hypothetical protein ABEDC_1015 [Acinetobacter lwoffii]|nr:hypothetical protein ABEDC_1015 [Acinetobacter lwoffii]